MYGFRVEFSTPVYIVSTINKDSSYYTHKFSRVSLFKLLTSHPASAIYKKETVLCSRTIL